MKVVLASEYLISMGIVSWGAIKKGYYPWPPSIVYASIAYSLLSFVSLADERIANLLGAGLLLAQLLAAMSNDPNVPNFIYQKLEGNPLNGATPFSIYKMKFSGEVGV